MILYVLAACHCIEILFVLISSTSFSNLCLLLTRKPMERSVDNTPNQLLTYVKLNRSNFSFCVEFPFTK